MDTRTGKPCWYVATRVSSTNAHGTGFPANYNIGMSRKTQLQCTRVESITNWFRFGVLWLRPIPHAVQGNSWNEWKCYCFHPNDKVCSICSYVICHMWLFIYDYSYVIVHIWLIIYDCSYVMDHIWLLTCVFRGYTNHADPETDSDGDGGSGPKLRGGGHIEFSKKGIPHGILHFPRQIQLAGHVLMHDTTASEASHRFNVKKVVNRVRKGTDYLTSASSIDWVFRVRTWAKVIDKVNEECGEPLRKRTCKRVESLTAIVQDSHLLVPTADVVDALREYTFSPLRRSLFICDCSYVIDHMWLLICDWSCVWRGGDRLLCNDARLSYHEFATLVSSYTGWDIDSIKDTVTARLYCSACVHHPGGERRTYWATETRYLYNKGSRRDVVEVKLGPQKSGCAQITAFIKLNHGDQLSEGVLIRWMTKSSLSTQTDDKDRPLCDFPLSSNHCLWEWAKTRRNRDCFRVRSFRRQVDTQNLWSHVQPQRREHVILSERKARYDIIGYDAIVNHVNVHKDPSTGHMLQTLQII